MKPLLNFRKTTGALAAITLSCGIAAHAQEVTVDGARDVFGPEGYTLLHTQTTASGWGNNQVLANIYAKQEGSTLFLHIAGKMENNALVLFIDSKPSGVGFIRNNLITSGGDEHHINNLGSSPTAGLTFENGFAPDYALRVYGQGTNAYVNTFNFTTGVRTNAGNAGPNIASSAFLSSAKAVWADSTPAQYATANLGLEMSFSLGALGVPAGSQNIKLMAVLVNGDSNYGSNQVLGTRSASTTDIAGGINAINFETEPGTQTLTFAVTNNDTDDDGDPNETDSDDDNDGLLDIYETNDGVYKSPTDTGTDPLVADTDSDGASDGDEVLNSQFGFLSNPNIPNFEFIAVPGNYTVPEWQAPGSDLATTMTRVDDTLTGQYQWFLDHRFTTVGAFEYKFAADADYDNSWGDGGNNITGLIQGTGFHTFSFNNATLARSLVRKVFPDVNAYLAAYGVTGSSDPDGDGVTSANEFIKNSDPTVADTDGDGVNDLNDANPLAATRNIVFNVNMSVQETMGNFNPAVDGVVVDFFNGLVGNLGDLALTNAGGGIWTGTLTAFEGPAGTSIGEFKFKNTRPGAPDGGYEGAINNRTLLLGPADVTQTVDVYFNDITTPPGGGYASWATANAGGEASNLDYDKDGVANGIEYFMGQTGSTFTPNPPIIAGVVTWPHSATATGITWRVWTSENLSSWTDVTANAVDSDGTLKYTLPTGSTKRFVRLEVVAP